MPFVILEDLHLDTIDRPYMDFAVSLHRSPCVEKSSFFWSFEQLYDLLARKQLYSSFVVSSWKDARGNFLLHCQKKARPHRWRDNWFQVGAAHRLLCCSELWVCPAAKRLWAQHSLKATLEVQQSWHMQTHCDHQLTPPHTVAPSQHHCIHHLIHTKFTFPRVC